MTLVAKRPLIAVIVGGILGLFLLIQLVPYGRNHTNPPVVAEPAWDSPQTRELFFRACGDCHSNQTNWPWYSNIAPISWLVQRDVDLGRARFNVSEWGLPRRNEGHEAVEKVQDGSMPPAIYLVMHPEARLPAQELRQLLTGLAQTFGTENGEREERPGRGRR
jgi:hypothetical protein